MSPVKSMYGLRVLACWWAVALGSGALLLAQELEPRTYSQTPTGVNFIAVGYGLSSGNVLMDPALPIEGLDSAEDTAKQLAFQLDAGLPDHAFPGPGLRTGIRRDPWGGRATTTPSH